MERVQAGLVAWTDADADGGTQDTETASQHPDQYVEKLANESQVEP